MSSYAQQQQQQQNGPSSNSSSATTEHDELQDTIGNAAVQEIINSHSIDPMSFFAGAYNNHVQQSQNINITLSETQMRNVELFQRHWERNQSRYENVAAQSDVPAKLIAALHWRESSGNFSTYLHQGDPLGRPAVNWPNNIPVFHEWEEAAIHALNMKRYNQRELGITQHTDNFAQVATYAEVYNGLGYHNRGRQSPYVYAGSSPYVSGKYVADGRFDRNHVDQQVGVVPLMGSIDGIQSQHDLSPQLISLESAWERVTNGQLVLRNGMNQMEVTALQTHLQDLGYLNSVDGDFGPGTERAVKEFQKDNGLSIDGLVGSGTAGAIELALRNHQNQSQNTQNTD